MRTTPTSVTTVCVHGRANNLTTFLRMQFEEDEARASDEDPEFTGAADTDAVDDEFLADDDLTIDDTLDADTDDDDDENNDIAADL